MEPLLHPRTRAQLGIIAAAPSGGYIFHGPAGVGKATAAIDLARRLNCQDDAAGKCEPCRKFEAGAYPDFIRLAPTDKPSITTEQVRQLTTALGLGRYFAGSRRVVVIDEADMMTASAQNALLKFIEEPPSMTHFILVARELESLLPTVRSRLGSVYFAPLLTSDIEAWLSHDNQLKPAEAAVVAKLSGGAPGRAILLASDAKLRETEQDLAASAANTLGSSLFERLLLIKRLNDTKASPLPLARQLHLELLARLEAGTPAAEIAGQLAALETFRIQLAAGVGARVAAERLMVELV